MEDTQADFSEDYGCSGNSMRFISLIWLRASAAIPDVITGISEILFSASVAILRRPFFGYEFLMQYCQALAIGNRCDVYIPLASPLHRRFLQADSKSDICPPCRTGVLFEAREGVSRSKCHS